MKTVADVTRIYQDCAIAGASPVEMVILLYEAAIEDMRRALTAMKKSDIETRTAQVSHALMLLQQLQGTLDFQQGGDAAKQFEQFYNMVRAKLLEAQMRGSSELMQQQIRMMSEVRDCWVQAGRLLQPRQAAGSVAAGDAAIERGGESEWNA